MPEELPDFSRGGHQRQEPVTSPVSGRGLPESPYTQLPDLNPNSDRASILRTQQKLQRSGLQPAQDQALRVLANLTSRLAWDLRTLGTTPGVSHEQWQPTFLFVERGQFEEGLRYWLAYPDSDSVLHVRAVLSLLEVAGPWAVKGGASETAVERFMACWTALLWRRDWLADFCRHRCQVWQRALPDAGDLAQFMEKVEKATLETLQTSSANGRRERWSGAWDRERATIEAVARACGSRASPPNWPAGYGPIGIASLGRDAGSDFAPRAEAAAQAWLCEASNANTWPLPISSLKSGEAGFYKLNPEQVAAAAAAVQYLFSGMGYAAAEIWYGRGRRALERLRESAAAQPKHPGPELADSWFGKGKAGRRRMEQAAAALEVEALLLEVQDALGRPDMGVEEISEIAGKALFAAGSLGQPRVAVRHLEGLVTGRLLSCADARRPPHPDEVERIIQVSLEIRSMLLGRGEGRECGQQIARLLNRRAVAAWNKKATHKRAAAQENVLRDLFQAANVAPHNSEAVTNLASVALAFPAKSEAEKRSLLRRAFEYVSNCRRTGSSIPELEECYNRLQEKLDPEAARARVLRELQEAVGAPPKRSQ